MPDDISHKMVVTTKWNDLYCVCLLLLLDRPLDAAEMNC
jgi:hypothetical protein